jgi:hypothetical protein
MVNDEGAPVDVEHPVEASLDDVPPTQSPTPVTSEGVAEPPVVERETEPLPGDAVDEADDADQDATDSEDDPAPDQTRKKAPKKRGRASVPSWDEIMFGGSSGSDRA